MPQVYPTLIPGLRSLFDQVNGLVYFGRMLDKIRLHAAGKLPEGWQAAPSTAMKGVSIRAAASFSTSITRRSKRKR